MQKLNTIVKFVKKYTNFYRRKITQETYKCFTRYMKKYTNFHRFTEESYIFSKHYSKIREKVYKFPYSYSRNI